MVVVLNIFQMYLTIQVVIINYNMVLVLIFWLMLEMINFCTICHRRIIIRCILPLNEDCFDEITHLRGFLSV